MFTLSWSNIPVGKIDIPFRRHDVTENGLCYDNRAVAPPGAAHRYSQICLTLFFIQGDQIVKQVQVFINEYTVSGLSRTNDLYLSFRPSRRFESGMK